MEEIGIHLYETGNLGRKGQFLFHLCIEYVPLFKKKNSRKLSNLPSKLLMFRYEGIGFFEKSQFLKAFGRFLANIFLA